jgi:hypothetical protein
MLTDSVRALRREWQRCRQSWDDRNAQRFEETFIAPIEPASRQALEAMERLGNAADDARRACE